MSKTWGFFLVLSHRAKFQRIINFFRVSMYFVVFLPDYKCCFAGFAFDVYFGCFVLHLQLQFLPPVQGDLRYFFISIIFHKNPRLIFAQNLKTIPASSSNKNIRSEKDQIFNLKSNYSKFCTNSKR